MPKEQLTAMGLYQYRELSGGQPWPLYAESLNACSCKSMAGNVHWQHLKYKVQSVELSTQYLSQGFTFRSGHACWSSRSSVGYRHIQTAASHTVTRELA